MNFRSDALGKQTSISVILPEQGEIPENGWKTLTLLHGWGGNHTTWLEQSSIARYAAKRQIAVIMPDVGHSYCNDMVYGDKYLTYLTEDLPKVCNRFFRTSLQREDNYIAGSSMGGCGALTVGLTRPDLYAGIIVLSATNFPVDSYPEQARTLVWPGWFEDMTAIYGEKFPYDLEGTDYDAYHLARKIVAADGPYPKMFHYMGLDETDGMRWAHQMESVFLSFEGNPFEYHLVAYPGLHNFDSWDVRIQEGLDYMGLVEKPMKKRSKKKVIAEK